MKLPLDGARRDLLFTMRVTPEFRAELDLLVRARGFDSAAACLKSLVRDELARARASSEAAGELVAHMTAPSSRPMLSPERCRLISVSHGTTTTEVRHAFEPCACGGVELCEGCGLRHSFVIRCRSCAANGRPGLSYEATLPHLTEAAHEARKASAREQAAA